jgi:hypothetical protein
VAATAEPSRGLPALAEFVLLASAVVLPVAFAPMGMILFELSVELFVPEEVLLVLEVVLFGLDVTLFGLDALPWVGVAADSRATPV